MRARRARTAPRRSMTRHGGARASREIAFRVAPSRASVDVCARSSRATLHGRTRMLELCNPIAIHATGTQSLLTGWVPLSKMAPSSTAVTGECGRSEAQEGRCLRALTPLVPGAVGLSEPRAEGKREMSDLWHHYQEGGWAMWLILFWLICSIAVIVERASISSARRSTRTCSSPRCRSASWPVTSPRP